MACFNSTVPLTGVYLVKLAWMAAMAACLMFSGVGKSGSPALKSTTSTPARRRRSASAATFMVDDSLISEILSAKACRAGMVGHYSVLEVHTPRAARRFFIRPAPPGGTRGGTRRPREG